MIQLTDRARDRIQGFVDADVVRDPALRIGLAAGDAPRSPLERRYAITLVEREDKERTEIAINLEGIRVLLNLDTSNLLSGATIDWSEDESGFLVETPQPKRATPPPERAAAASPNGDPLADKVQQVLDELINPRIAAHGGAVEMVDLADGTLYVRMMGGCQGCAASAATLRQGVERMVREELPEIVEVVDLTDHTAGANPYY